MPALSTPVRVTAYAAALAVAFVAALGAGRASGIEGRASEPGRHGTEHGSGESSSGGGPSTIVPAGLAVAQDGYALDLDQVSIPAGVASTLTFRIRGTDGPVTSYTTTHDRKLHLIVVRRDLATFQHVHPVLGADGTWSVPLTLAEAGPYKVYADFAPDDRTTAIVLATDLTVPGSYTPAPRGPDTATTTTGGDTVVLDGSLTAGTESPLALTVTREGSPVSLQPYLGAFGHLVVIRTGDLAYLHVHPDEGDGLRFLADVPTPGTYRAFLDYQHDDVVRTAPFTLTAR